MIIIFQKYLIHLIIVLITSSYFINLSEEFSVINKYLQKQKGESSDPVFRVILFFSNEKFKSNKKMVIKKHNLIRYSYDELEGPARPVANPPSNPVIPQIHVSTFKTKIVISRNNTYVIMMWVSLRHPVNTREGNGYYFLGMLANLTADNLINDGFNPPVNFVGGNHVVIAYGIPNPDDNTFFGSPQIDNLFQLSVTIIPTAIDYFAGIAQPLVLQERHFLDENTIFEFLSDNTIRPAELQDFFTNLQDLEKETITFDVE